MGSCSFCVFSLVCKTGMVQLHASGFIQSLTCVPLFATTQGLQDTRLPCPSLLGICLEFSLGICSNSCPLMEKAMATHSSTLAWRIPWMEEPGGLQSMGSWRVGHNWATSLSLFTFMHWRRKWQPTPVFLPGGSQGWQGLVGCHLWGRTESDTTEAT